jgi:hypothetical protein
MNLKSGDSRPEASCFNDCVAGLDALDATCEDDHRRIRLQAISLPNRRYRPPAVRPSDASQPQSGALAIRRAPPHDEDPRDDPGSGDKCIYSAKLTSTREAGIGGLRRPGNVWGPAS